MRARALSLVALGLALAACSVVEDGRVEPIDPPAGLSDTLPSTTTAPSTTAAPTTTVPEETTTTPAVQSEQVRLYFITGDQLTSVTAQLPAPADPALILRALQAGPPEGELGNLLRSALPATADVRVTTDGSGVARVDLPDGFFDTISVGDQRLVIGQIVLTLTDSRGIGQVVFDQAVSLPSGELPSPGQPIAFRDFQSMLSATTATGATPTTTPAPTSSAA